MSLLNLFILYSLGIAAASLLGGKLPGLVKLTHTRMQMIMSFVAGLMLGVACYRLLPHAIFTMERADAVDLTVWWLLIGLLAMFILLRTFHFHHHEYEAESETPDDHHHHGHSHTHADTHTHAHEVPAGPHPLSWVGVAIGLTLHTLIDGIALGAAIQADVAAGAGGLFSVGVFIAILLHKPLDAMSITSLMNDRIYKGRTIALVNALFALMCPLGALLFFWGVDGMGNQAVVVGSALAFSAGVFFCISLSDLLPEVQFHSHDSVKLTLALILGVALAYGIRHLEPEHLHAAHAGLPYGAEQEAHPHP